MHDQGYPRNSDPPRSAIDRYAVTAAGHVLMSAIWLEHRVRSFSTQLGTLPSPHTSIMPVVSSSASRHSDRGLLVLDGRGDPPSPRHEKGNPQ